MNSRHSVHLVGRLENVKLPSCACFGVLEVDGDARTFADEKNIDNAFQTCAMFLVCCESKKSCGVSGSRMVALGLCFVMGWRWHSMGWVSDLRSRVDWSR